MHTPMKTVLKVIKIKSPKFDLTRFLNFSVLTGITILIGCILKILFPLNRNTIGKDSLITGIPFIRTAFFAFPIMITVGTLFWLITLYNNPEICSAFKYRKCKFFNKVRLGYLVTNFTILSVFYLLYSKLCLPLGESHGFKFSGHVIACLFSGSMLINIETLCDMFRSQNIKREYMEFMIKVIKFLLYHNVYSVFWTAWVFHSIRETVFSFLFAFVLIVLLNSLGLDKRVIFILNNETRHRVKEKNKFLDNKSY